MLKMKNLFHPAAALSVADMVPPIVIVREMLRSAPSPLLPEPAREIDHADVPEARMRAAGGPGGAEGASKMFFRYSTRCQPIQIHRCFRMKYIIPSRIRSSLSPDKRIRQIRYTRLPKPRSLRYSYTSFRPETVLFRPGGVNQRSRLCGVQSYASGNPLIS